jgi:hypothetical protein
MNKINKSDEEEGSKIAEGAEKKKFSKHKKSLNVYTKGCTYIGIKLLSTCVDANRQELKNFFLINFYKCHKVSFYQSCLTFF